MNVSDPKQLSLRLHITRVGSFASHAHGYNNRQETEALKRNKVELVPGFSLHALFLWVLKFLQHFVQVHCRACQHEVGTEVGAVGYSTCLK